MPKIGGDRYKLMTYLQAVADSGHFTEGRFVRQLEDMVSDFYGAPAIAVSSCGAGLFGVGKALGLADYKNGWLAPNNTFMATIAMIWESTGRNEDFEPYLIDCNRKDFSMEYRDVVGAIDEAGPFDLCVYTHVGGMISDEFEAIATLCDETETVLIEDRAHAFGIMEPLRGQAAVFSLYPTKSIPVGEGGIVITNDPDIEHQLRRYRNYGKFKDDNGTMCYDVEVGGFNLRMDEWTAAVAVFQMERMAEIMEKREQAAYQLSQVVRPMYEPPADKRNWYKFIAPASFPAVHQAGKVYARTDQMSGVYPEFANGIGDVFENSAWVAENHICLPIDEDMYAGMSTGEIEAYLTGADKK